MASLANKDSYLQRMAQKICTQEVQEPRKRKFGAAPGDEGPHSKKKKRRKKPPKQLRMASVPPSKQTVPKNAGMTKPPPGIGRSPSAGGSVNAGGKGDDKKTLGSFSAMNLLRNRLHEKIREVSGQGANENLSPAVLEKRQRRKYERERKKRRRKELKMKEKMEKKEAEEASEAAILDPQEEKESKVEIVFNKVEAGEEEKPMSKAEKRREKKKKVKGNITPLTGKNYKQLLSRLESRKNKLEELREKDEKKAKELETKMKWTNVLYKAEGVKIRDDEEKLKAALKHKEKRKAQRQKQWEKRTEHVVDKMEQRQEKRRKNLQKKKLAKVERKKAKARKKGRILPEDLEKAGRK